jgi:sugar lactone lactonase YvrE
MKTTRQFVLTIALASLFAVHAPSEEVPNTPVALNAAAVKAYQEKDYATFLKYEKRAHALEPANPRFLYNMACGESLTGNGTEAIRLLSQLADRKLDLGAENDDDLAAVRKTPEWTVFQTKMADLRKPFVHSEVAFKLPEPALVATGIAVDSRSGDTYIGSVRTRKIVRRTKSGEVSDFVRESQDGFLSAGSLGIDPPRQILYASSSAVPFMRGYRKEDEGKSGVFSYDLKSGKLLRKVFLVPDGKPHFLNAMVIARDGNVYVSDSLASGIYRLRPGAQELEVFVPKEVFKASQGLAFSDDEKTMFVVDYSDGLWALDMASKERRHIDGPPDVWLAGLDGLSRAGNGYITVQIGVRPERVLRLNLDAKGQKIGSVDILEMSHPEYDGPIQGVIDGQSFFYVANSQLRLGNGQTGAFTEDQGRPTLILKLPI